jgi:hypothetical protein
MRKLGYCFGAQVNLGIRGERSWDINVLGCIVVVEGDAVKGVGGAFGSPV